MAILFLNYHHCPCGEEWTDEWSCMCDDRCPSCNTPCSPIDSEQIGDDDDDDDD